METMNDIIYFESDEEFTDFCLAPYAVVKQTETGIWYVEGEYSDLYKKAIKKGTKFIIKDEDSAVYRRKCVTKRVPVQGTCRDTLIQMEVQNLELYFEDF